MSNVSAITTFRYHSIVQYKLLCNFVTRSQSYTHFHLFHSFVFHNLLLPALLIFISISLIFLNLIECVNFFKILTCLLLIVTVIVVWVVGTFYNYVYNLKSFLVYFSFARVPLEMYFSFPIESVCLLNFKMNENPLENLLQKHFENIFRKLL